ncbi:hypothetical protein ACJX0J_019357, partial [Zea mays]
GFSRSLDHRDGHYILHQEYWKEGDGSQHLAGGFGDIVDDHVADFLIENGIPLLVNMESWKEDRDKKILLTGGDHMAGQIGQPLDPTRCPAYGLNTRRGIHDLIRYSCLSLSSNGFLYVILNDYMHPTRRRLACKLGLKK